MAEPEELTRTEASAAKPDVVAVFAFYNVRWHLSRFNRVGKHKATLAADLREALEDKCADVVLLSECGEIGVGLGKQWLELVRSICGPGFLVTHDSHYTSIVREQTVEVLDGPTLRGPLARGQQWRMCQHLRVRVGGSAAKPIDLYNVHSPSSDKHKLT